MPEIGMGRVVIPPAQGRRPGIIDHKELANSIQGKLTTSHATEAAMITAANAHLARPAEEISDDQKRAFIAHVVGKGWFLWTATQSGGSWTGTYVPLQAKGFTFISGRADVSTDDNGLFAIAHPFGTSLVLPLFSYISVSLDGNYDAATYMEARISVVPIETNPTGVVFRAWNQSTFQVYAKAAMALMYKIEKL